MAQKRITRTGLDDLRIFLKSLPEIAKSQDVTFSGQQAIVELKTEIVKLMKKGYTLVNIAELMSKQGFEIKSPTLKTYLNRAGGKRKVTSGVAQSAKTESQSATKPGTPEVTVAATSGNKNTTIDPAMTGTTRVTSGGQQTDVQGNSGRFSVRPDSEEL